MKTEEQIRERLERYKYLDRKEGRTECSQLAIMELEWVLHDDN